MEAETKNLKTLFKQMDRDKDGAITKDEMHYAVENIGLVLANDDIDMIFAKYDSNKTGQLEFTEFVAAFMQRNALQETRKLEDFFEYLDTDHTGFIDYEEIHNGLGSAFISADNKSIFSKFAGKDRKLNKIEFVDFMNYIIEESKNSRQLDHKKTMGPVSRKSKRSKSVKRL